jgi:centrosomal protein CEP104
MTAPSLEDELNMDKSTFDTLKELHLLKEQAVQREEFDEAKRLKVAIDRIRAVAGQLGALEERKRMAIASEDYDAAKLIKVEIDKIKRQAMTVDSVFSQTLPPVVDGSRP